MGLFSNAEFLRNVRGQLRASKVIVSAAICAAISISTGYLFAQRGGRGAGPPIGWAFPLLQATLGLQALILAAGGGIACLNSVYREKEHNTFDFQRVTRLTPLQLTIGKLFGAPVLMYFIALCFLPLAVFAAIVGKAHITFVLAAYFVLFAGSVTFHSLTLLIPLLTVRGSHTSA